MQTFLYKTSIFIIFVNRSLQKSAQLFAYVKKKQYLCSANGYIVILACY